MHDNKTARRYGIAEFLAEIKLTMKKMKIIKPIKNGWTGILQGFSTLDFKNMRIASLFLLIIVFGGPIYAGHSILDRIDPTFNPDVVSNLYGGKFVYDVEAQPDGKLLVAGNFSSFNGVSVGKVVRLTADGLLDTTFNNQTVTSIGMSNLTNRFIIQPDGKIILFFREMVADGQAPKSLLRLNADGTVDTSFNYTLNPASKITTDSLGRIVLAGFIQTPQGLRKLVRLNGDGSLDTSFNFTTLSNNDPGYIAAQGTRLLIFVTGNNNNQLYRLNEDGSPDPSFPVISYGIFGINGLLVQPDNKILYLNDSIRRMNENGGNDDTFQPIVPAGNGMWLFKLAPDGKIVVWTGGSVATFKRFLSNGAPDPLFTPYTHPAYSYCFTIQSDGRIIMGDQTNLNSSTVPINNFIRLTPGGVPDSTFNPGGVGFQNILPGSLRAIEVLPDGKILLGGKFDVVNNVARHRLVRLNTDATVDLSFQVNTSGTGNYFSTIKDIYQIRAQSDGKIVVSGWFDYVLGGAAKRNLVRLNADGSIDTTFDLAHSMPDYSEIVGAGRNRFALLSDGKLMVGTSKNSNLELSGPTKLTTGGAVDASFNPTINSQSPQMYIDDVAIQPDGKILIGGSHRADFMSPFVSFVARLNADGSTDQTFVYSEEANRLRTTLALLPNGKILVGRHANGIMFGTVKRLNADGSPDASFNSLSIPNGIINALLSLPNGKIFVGGRFTVTVNGQETKNLLRLDADGNIEPTTYNVNEEVLCLAVDGQGRVLVGGSFTVIGANGAGASRSYVARLTDSPTLFDYDGDGKADVSVYRPSNNYWYLLRSSNSQSTYHYFGAAGDIPTPADYDGDGKTDLAIFRPSSGDWWYQSSITGAFINKHWGSNGDIPLPSDFDGDGKADYIVYHPANNYWYRLSSGTGQESERYFGAAGDKPVTGDFDGDGKSDPAVFRPSTGVFWYMSSLDSLHRAIQWGTSTDIPVPADYDGDGKTDAAVYRPSNGVWYIFNSGTSTYSFTNFGTSEDKPIPADYDGDGKADIAVYRSSNGTWYLLRSTSGFTAQQFGNSSDFPTPNAFVP